MKEWIQIISDAVLFHRMCLIALAGWNFILTIGLAIVYLDRDRK